MPEIESEHFYPRPWLRRIVERLILVTLVLALVALAAQIILALIVGPLLCGTAVFTAVLIIPLLMRSVLHPEVSITADGLILRPMLWSTQTIPWSAITEIVAHPLVFNDEGTGRLLHGKNYRPREGVVVIVDPSAKLLPIYRLVGELAGAGNNTAFAVSSTTHTNYDQLIETIRQHTDSVDIL
jgi:hypothetical protein